MAPSRRLVRRYHRVGRCVAVAVALIGAGGCRQTPRSEIQLVVDEGGPTQVNLTAHSAFAEYVELPDHHHELRIVLADYETSCKEFTPPEKGQTLLTLTILTPPATPPKPGKYHWKAEGDTAVEAPVETPYSVPKAHYNGRSFLFRPGGFVELSSVELVHHGHVVGLLDYEYSGDPEHAATAIRGSFAARFCRFLQAPPE